MSCWIKVDQKLIDHEKTFVLAEELNLDEVHVIGYLVTLWSWAIDHHPDGVLPESNRLIARACRWDGPADAFVQALVMAGFVDDDYMGKRTIHDWEEYSGELIRKRAANAKRMREARKKPSA